MNKEHYNEALDALIRLAGFELLEAKASEMPTDLSTQNIDVDFKEMDKEIDRMIRREIAKHRFIKFTNVMKKAAAVLVVVIVISAIATVSSQALRIKFLNLFNIRGEVSTEITISEDNFSNNIDSNCIIPEYMPEGYELSETTKMEAMFISTYRNSNNCIIRIEQSMDGYEATADNERFDCFETEVSGKKVYVIDKGSKNIVCFNTSEYGFIITGEIEVSEILKIVKSIID